MVDQFRWDLAYHYYVYQVREGDPRFPWSIGVDLVLVRLGGHSNDNTADYGAVSKTNGLGINYPM